MHHHVAADASFTTIKNGFGHYVFIADNQTILVGGEVDGKITLLTFDPTLQLTSVEKKKIDEGSRKIFLQDMTINREDSMGFVGNRSDTGYNVIGSITVQDKSETEVTEFKIGSSNNLKTRLHSITYLASFNVYMTIGEVETRTVF